MCGLLGWFQLEETNERMQTESLIKALKECSTRGLDATGFYTPNLGVLKFPVGAYEMATSKKDVLQTLAKETLVIGHCRSASHGKEKGVWASRDKNENNHPHEGKRWVVVHNGWFGSLPKIKGYEYKGECDSEIFLSWLETFGLQKALEMQCTDDKYAVVIYDKEEKKLYFYRHTNPLCYTYDFERKAIVWGSTLKIVRELEDVDYYYHGIKEGCQSTCWELPENTLYSFNDDMDLDELEKIVPMYSTTMRDNKFKEEMKLTTGLSWNEIKNRNSEDKIVPFVGADFKLKSSVKSVVYLTVGMVGNEVNQMLKMFPPLIPGTSKGLLSNGQMVN